MGVVQALHDALLVMPREGAGHEGASALSLAQRARCFPARRAHAAGAAVRARRAYRGRGRRGVAPLPWRAAGRLRVRARALLGEKEKKTVSLISLVVAIEQGQPYQRGYPQRLQRPAFASICCACPDGFRVARVGQRRSAADTSKVSLHRLQFNKKLGEPVPAASIVLGMGLRGLWRVMMEEKGGGGVGARSGAQHARV